MQKPEFDTTLTHLWTETFAKIELNEVLMRSLTQYMTQRVRCECKLALARESQKFQMICPRKFARLYQIDSVV